MMHPDDHYTLIAKADYGEGFLISLYKTNQGQYFSTVRTAPGRTESVNVLTVERALETYQKLPIHPLEFSEAFPSLLVEDSR